MSAAAPDPVARLLVEWGQGKEEALQALMPLVYAELCGLARRYLRREPATNTLQSAGLVHEAYCKLVEQKHTTWKNRAQFVGVAAQLMRRILVDRARKHDAAKRGAAISKLSLDEAFDFPEARDRDLLSLDEALRSLERLSPQHSRIVELRFFGGLSIEEVAEVLHVSASTVKRDWAMSKAWLHQQISQRAPA
ncbi:MAG TPA: ECF-type sigma factor [Myxococcaceae bacterium]|nr:ECF-type sigma factor [Myxococcaceae bacterium]